MVCLAEAAAMLRVVGVVVLVDEVAAAEGPVVCDGGPLVAAIGDADGVSCEDCAAERLVSGAGVAALVCCASAYVGCSGAAVAAATCGDDGWAGVACPVGSGHSYSPMQGGQWGAWGSCSGSVCLLDGRRGSTSADLVCLRLSALVG